MGSSGLLDATLSPVETHFNEAGMCVVNVHWHLGAEHKNVGTYDIDGEEWMEQHGKTKPKAHGANVVPGHGYGYGNVKGAVPLGEHDDIDPGNFCPGYDEALLLRSPACAQLRTAQLWRGVSSLVCCSPTPLRMIRRGQLSTTGSTAPTCDMQPSPPPSKEPSLTYSRTCRHVGFTYEIHWPHSSLGACGTPWQMQSHFMDGAAVRLPQSRPLAPCLTR